MRKLTSRLFLIGCALATLSSYAWAASLTFGETLTGTISSAGQSNSYSLSANAGDVADFTLVTTTGNLSPKIQVYSATGQLLGTAYPSYCNGSTIELNTLTIPAGGTDIVVVSDCSGSNTGNYTLYAQSTNSPAGASSLSFGVTGAGTLASAAQSNTYTFSANGNDVVNFTMVVTSGSVSPKLRLYNPSGQQIASASPSYCNGGTIEMDTVTIPASGTYTLLVGDCSDTHTGNYALYVQRTNNPSGALILPLDVTQTGALGSAAQNNTYTFSASANSVVDFTMVTTSGSLSPKIRLYNPSGQQVASASPSYCNGSTIEMNTVTLPVSGAYTVLLADCSDINSGNYDLYMQMTEQPLGAANLPFGQSQNGTINLAAQSNTYTFGANAGDVVDFTMANTSGNLVPKIRLYNSAGQQIASASPSYCNGPTVELNTVTLPSSDIYTVLVGDCSDANTGGYTVYLQRTNNPSGAAMLLFGQTETGSIAAKTQSNSYIFAGSANDVIDLTLVTTSGSFVPKIRVYSPTGAQVAAANPSYCNGSTLELNTVTLPSTGTYTVLVGDCSDTNSGNYILYSQRINDPFGPTPFLFGGGTQGGSIVSQAQNNTLTFSATANSVADFTMVTTSGSLAPRIRLYNPDGALIASASPSYCNGSTTQLNSVTLALAGIYTVLASDCSDTQNGNYNLSGLCFGTCLVMPAITWATPAAITHPTRLSATQLDASSPVGGAFAYNPKAGQVLAAGPQNLSVTLTPADGSTYSTATDAVQLLVKSGLSIGLSHNTLSFGKQVINTTSPAKSIIVTNTGTASLNIDGISVSADFAISANTCGTKLAAGKTCEVSVTFTPTQTGSLAGALRFDDNVPDSPQTVTLSGAGSAQ